MSDIVISEPPEVEITEATLKYHVVKVYLPADPRPSEIVFTDPDRDECWKWMVNAFLAEIRTDEPRSWKYQLQERKRIFTTEVENEL